MLQKTVLVIDDEPQMRKLLEISLEANGFKSITASTGEDGIRMAASHSPDLILLDIQLPDQNGHEVLKKLIQWYTKPIIMLSVLNNEMDVVQALETGAVDYLNKPYRNAELMARIQAAMRRNNATLLPDHASIHVHDLVIDSVGRTVTQAGKYVKLTGKEFDILYLLAQHQGRVLTHHFLLKQVWGIAYQQETQYLRVFIASIRKKIEPDPDRPIYIITESGIGYRFL